MSPQPIGPSRPLAIVATAAVLGTVACGSAGSGAVTASDPAVGANPGDSVALYVDLDNAGSVSYTHLTLPTTIGWCRYRWSPYH